MTRKNYSKGADRGYRSSDATWRAWARDDVERAVNGNGRRRRTRISKQLARARPPLNAEAVARFLKMLTDAKTEADVFAAGRYGVKHLLLFDRDRLRPTYEAALARVRSTNDSAAEIERYRQQMKNATKRAELMRVAEAATKGLSRQDRETLWVDFDQAMERLDRAEAQARELAGRCV